MTDATHEFFVMGTQYYLAGRFAAFAGLNPVTGNLLHHAVEMLLKGALAKTKTLEEMKKLSHSFSKIWAEVKGADSSLDRFDEMIVGLDAFETIRYPDKVLALGMGSEIAIVKGPPALFGGTGSSVPRYRVCVQEIDELVEALFRIASRSAAAYLRPMKADAQRYLYLQNLAFTNNS
jgi:hypothetical protein